MRIARNLPLQLKYYTTWEVPSNRKSFSLKAHNIYTAAALYVSSAYNLFSRLTIQLHTLPNAHV